MKMRIVSAVSIVMISIGCGGALQGGKIDLSKIPTPQIVIAPAPSPAPSEPKSMPKPMATLAFHVVNLAGDELESAIATVKKDGTQIDVKQANAQGYIPFVLETGAFYDVTFEAADYKTITRKFQFTENRQWEIVLSREGEPIVPKPITSPVVIPPATTMPIVAQPLLEPADGAKDWSDQQWRDAFFSILKKHGNPRTVNLQTLNDTRADIEALGAEWQHDSAGTLRPRLFLPVPPGADRYGRAFDVGLYGEAWQWIKR